MFNSIGFIGGGRITRIILGGFDRKEKWPDNVIVSDNNADVLKDLQKRFPKIEAAAHGRIFCAVIEKELVAPGGKDNG